MILTLFVALALSPSEAAYAPQISQPTCPWNTEALTLLSPELDQSSEAIVPAVGSIWFRVNDGITPIGQRRPTLHRASGETIPLLTEETNIPTGGLLELTPIGGLTDGETYTLRYETRQAKLTAVEMPEPVRPEAPELIDITPIDQAAENAACNTVGVLVTVVEDGAALHLFVDDENKIRAVSSTNQLIVIGNYGAELCGRVLAVNVSGTRSEPSERFCDFATGPQQQFVDYVEDDGPFGCSATGSANAHHASLSLAFFTMLALLLSSRVRSNKKRS